MKKIYLLRLRHIEFYFFLLIGFFWIIYNGPSEFDDIFVRIEKFGLFELIFGLMFTFGIPAFMMALEWFGYGRELFHTVIDENGFQSYRFRKKYCYVDKNKDIYYTIHYDSYYKEEYIAFSNEPFKMFELTYIAKKYLVLGYIHTYDYRKVILLPYNKKTLLEFDVENWKEAEYIRFGQYNWKTKTTEIRDPNAKP